MARPARSQQPSSARPPRAGSRPTDELAARWQRAHPAGGSAGEALLRRLRAGAPDPDPASRDLRGIRLIGENLAGVDLSGCDLSGADLSRADLSGARLGRARLRDTVLFGVDLTGAELLGADLAGADLTDVRGSGAGFGGADLAGATLFNAQLSGATFTQATLRDADLRGADLNEARIREANLQGANLARAELTGADLEQSAVDGASFHGAGMRGIRPRGITGYGSADWIGADIVGVDFSGAYLLRRTIMDQNYLHEFRTQSRTTAVLYWIWWATSDCGRSFARWGLWTALLAAVFAGLFQFVSVDYGDHPTPLSPFYYSVVTLTTLGYGDVVPASAAAQTLAMVEVGLGYVMLGGLLSIFANKMARRAE